jgi:hypothetical protein
MIKCKECKCWQYQELFGKNSVIGYCVLQNSIDPFDRIDEIKSLEFQTNCDEGCFLIIKTGPNFGCVHGEKKEHS